MHARLHFWWVPQRSKGWSGVEALPFPLPLRLLFHCVIRHYHDQLPVTIGYLFCCQFHADYHCCYHYPLGVPFALQ